MGRKQGSEDRFHHSPGVQLVLSTNRLDSLERHLPMVKFTCQSTKILQRCIWVAYLEIKICDFNRNPIQVELPPSLSFLRSRRTTCSIFSYLTLISRDFPLLPARSAVLSKMRYVPSSSAPHFRITLQILSIRGGRRNINFVHQTMHYARLSVPDSRNHLLHPCGGLCSDPSIQPSYKECSP